MSTDFKNNTRLGMRVVINPNEYEGKKHKGEVFLVSSAPRDLCGTLCVSLRYLDGSRFSPAYDLSMLQPEVNK